jgi:hypothetical protein
MPSAKYALNSPLLQRSLVSEIAKEAGLFRGSRGDGMAHRLRQLRQKDEQREEDY